MIALAAMPGACAVHKAAIVRVDGLDAQSSEVPSLSFEQMCFEEREREGLNMHSNAIVYLRKSKDVFIEISTCSW